MTLRDAENWYLDSKLKELALQRYGRRRKSIPDTHSKYTMNTLCVKSFIQGENEDDIFVELKGGPRGGFME